MLPFLKDPKAVATMIVAEKSKPKEKEEAEELVPEEVAAEEVMAALEGKDPSALASSLKNFIEICQSKEYAEEE